MASCLKYFHSIFYKKREKETKKRLLDRNLLIISKLLDLEGMDGKSKESHGNVPQFSTCAVVLIVPHRCCAEQRKEKTKPTKTKTTITKLFFIGLICFSKLSVTFARTPGFHFAAGRVVSVMAQLKGLCACSMRDAGVCCAQCTAALCQPRFKWQK